MLPELARIDALIDNAQVEEALVLIDRIVTLVHTDPTATGEVYGSRELDRRCQRIGAIVRDLMKDEEVEPDTPVDDIYLVSGLFDIGGHSRLLKDFISSRPGRRVLVAISNIHGLEGEQAAGMGVARELMDKGCRMLMLERSGPLARLARLQRLLRPHPDSTVFIFTHHGDAAAISATQPGLNRQVVFVHHADHNLALGLFLPHAIHVDHHAVPFRHCKYVLGVPNVQNWPMPVPDQGQRPPKPRKPGDPLISVTCGSQNKYVEPYSIDYFDTIARMLLVTRGSHVHIGPLSEAAQARAAQALAQHQVLWPAFVHIPRVDDLWAHLLGSDYDFYLGSFPIWGARAIIEAMGCGLPVIYHQHAVSPALGDSEIGPPGSPTWQSVDELLALVGELDEDRLQRLGHEGRAHYERMYRPDRFAAVADAGHCEVEPGPRTLPLPDQYVRHRTLRSRE